MKITFQQFIALLPILILGLTVVIMMLCIAWKRNSFMNLILTCVGINVALLSIWLVVDYVPIDITRLMRVDNFSLFYTGLILFASFTTSTIAYSWLSGYQGNRDEFYLLILIATLGGILLSSANHLAALFIGIELISLPMFGMIGYAFHQKYSIEASIKYMLLSAVSSSFLLFGIAFIYASTGQLSFVGIEHIFHNSSIFDKPVILVGLSMIIAGLGFKLSLVPFHSWTPDVYQGAPAPVSIFLSTVSKISIFAVMIRFFLYVPIISNEIIRFVLITISFLSILFGNVMALSQKNSIKRVLGYSSIAHNGYLLVCLITIPSYTFALETVGIYLIGYLFASLGTFGIISLMSNSRESEDVDSLCSYRGLFWKNPLLSLILTVMMLSFAGIPMTLGFIGKFFIIMLGVDSKLFFLTGIIIIGSAIGLFYYLRIMIILYLSPKIYRHSHIYFNFLQMQNMGNFITIMSSLLVIILFGFYPQPLITLIQLAQPMFL